MYIEYGENQTINDLSFKYEATLQAVIARKLAAIPDLARQELQSLEIKGEVYNCFISYYSFGWTVEAYTRDNTGEIKIKYFIG